MNYIILFINLFVISMKKQYIILKILILLIVSSGCSLDLEELASGKFQHDNQLFLNLEENLYEIDFNQYSGSDIIPFFMTDNLEEWTFTIDSNKTQVTYKRSFDYNQNDLSLFQINDTSKEKIIHSMLSPILNKSLLLDKPMSINSSNLFVFKNYAIDAVFNSRLLPNQLKLIAEYSDEVDDINIFDLIDEIIELLYLETLRSVEIGFNHEQNYLSSIDAWSDEVKPDSLIMKPDDDLSLLEVAMSNLNFIVDAAEENLISKIDQQYVNEVKLAWIEKKTDLYLSLILLFNDFTVKATMPGDVTRHNANTISGDTLIWNFNLSDFTEKDYTINASSRVIYKNRIIICLIIVMLVVVGVVRKKYKN